MKLGDGVEQAIHCVTMLAQLAQDSVLPAAALAEFHGVSTSFLLKHLQALSRAGLVQAVPGPKGGYRLAKSENDITLLDVVLAVEGNEPAFRCREIRQKGPNPLPADSFRMPCQINAAMLRAEQAYRAELRQVSIATLMARFEAEDTVGAGARGCAFAAKNIRTTPLST